MLYFLVSIELIKLSSPTARLFHSDFDVVNVGEGHLRNKTNHLPNRQVRHYSPWSRYLTEHNSYSTSCTSDSIEAKKFLWRGIKVGSIKGSRTEARVQRMRFMLIFGTCGNPARLKISLWFVRFFHVTFG